MGHPGVSVPRVPDRAAGNAATPTSPSQPAVAIDAGSAVKTELVTTAVHGDVKESSTPSKQVELNATSEAAAVKTVKTEEMSDDEADEKSTGSVLLCLCACVWWGGLLCLCGCVWRGDIV